MEVNYSQKSNIQKLGIKSNSTVVVINFPIPKYRQFLGPLPLRITWYDRLDYHTEFIHCFVRSKGELEEIFPKLKQALPKNGVLWISNPKPIRRAHGEDFNQNDVMEIGLKNGLVDVKIASISKEWSAMKFVYRIKDRQ